MNFDLNDPLGDILSDDSNDSFFDDDKYKSTKSDKKIEDKNIGAKKTNLFGLENNDKYTINNETDGKDKSDWLGLTNSKPTTPNKSLGVNNTDNQKTTTTTKILGSGSNLQNFNIDNSNTLKTTTSKINTRISEKLDFLDDLDLFKETDIKNPSGSTSKTNTTLDDLFGKSSSSVTKAQEKDLQNIPKKDAPVSGYNPSSLSSSSIKKNITSRVIPRPNLRTDDFTVNESKENLKTAENTKNEIKETLTTSKRTKSKQDWLGLFSNNDLETLTHDETEAQKTLSELLNPQEKKQKVSKPSGDDEKNQSKITDSSDNEGKHAVPDKNLMYAADIHNLKNIENIHNTKEMINFSNEINIEQQSAALCLQQQEGHLMIALQLKAQEERLAAMHEKQIESRKIQKEVVYGHREHLERILKGQIDHRNQLQHMISQHQQRINEHVKSLLKPTDFSNEGESDLKYNEKNIIDEKKQEFEETQLENITRILNDFHEKEVELMENSYRRQLIFANESLILMEERYKEENEKLTEFYTTKMKKMQEDFTNLQEQSMFIVKSINEKHEEEKSRMELKHLKDIETLQQQHQIIIKNIKDSIETEHLTIKGTTDYSSKLNSILTQTDKNTEMCLGIMKILENNNNNSIESRNKEMKIKEEQITRLLENLEYQKQLYEVEINRRNDYLKVFEESVKQQTLLIDEEREALKNKQYELETEKKTLKLEYENLKKQFDMEKQIFEKNKIHIDKSNEQVKTDIEEQFKILEAEKLFIITEKKNILELKSQNQAMKTKLENEMQDLNEKKNIFEREHEKLLMNESKLLERSRDLENLTQSALAKQKNAENKLLEAFYVKQKYEDKLIHIQEQSLSLNAREQQIANDKISLSRERLLLYNQKAENDHMGHGNFKNILPKDTKIENVDYYEPNMETILNLHSYKNEILGMNLSKDFMKENYIDHNENDIYSNKINDAKTFK